jgi:hypothetical protein
MVTDPKEATQNMGHYSLSGIARIPDDVGGGPVKQIVIDLTNGSSIGFVPRDEPSVNTMPNGDFPPPDVLMALHQKAVEQRKVEVTTIVSASSDRAAYSMARGATERFLDWLSFLLLKPVVMLAYHEISGGDGSTYSIGFRPPFEERSGERGTVTVSSYIPPRTLDIGPYAQLELPEKLPWALKWYRKSLLAPEPEESFAYIWSGLETLADSLEGPPTPKTVVCDQCGHEIPLATVAKAGVIKHMKDNFGLSRTKFDKFFDLRSDIVHSKREMDESFRDDIASLMPMVSTVFITSALLLLNGTEDVTPWYSHPLLGDVSYLESTLR